MTADDLKMIHGDNERLTLDDCGLMLRFYLRLLKHAAATTSKGSSAQSGSASAAASADAFPALDETRPLKRTLRRCVRG